MTAIRVKLLVDTGADVNAKSDNGLTALIIAVANDHPSNLRLLLSAGADPNAKDKDGKTPMMWANEQGRAEIVRILKAAK